jgi:hypothetical protein
MMKSEALKAAIESALANPLTLFAVMLASSFGSMFKQWIDARKNGAELKFSEYLNHWPEIIYMLGMNIATYLTMFMTDTLNFAAAIGIGYANNSVADIFRSGGRSGATADAVSAARNGEDKS